MSLIERYRTLYEHEKDANHKMLAMIESVPEASRSDARFQRAVTIADHLAACRENWLTYMTGENNAIVLWFDPNADPAALRPRYTALESRWTDYLAGLDDDRLPKAFTFTEAGQTFSEPIEVQTEQLVGHAAYHRDRSPLLVDQLGGETVDTDYVDWWWARRETAP